MANFHIRGALIGPELIMVVCLQDECKHTFPYLHSLNALPVEASISNPEPGTLNGKPF